jgi:FG-GAP repeat
MVRNSIRSGVANPLVCGFCIFFVIGTSSAMTASKPVFMPPVVYNTGGLGTEFVAVADVNGDNKPDLIVASQGGAPNGVGGSVAVLLGKHLKASL